MDGPLKGYLWTTRSSYEYILGDYEDPQVIETFCSLLKPHSVFYDLGANVGFHSLLANRYITKGKIYSFEPQPGVRKIFESHIALNKKRMPGCNIEIFPFAISDTEKEVLFSDDLKQTDGNTYIKSSPVFTAAENTITVKCYSLDGLMEAGYAPPGIIKIDVEGAEYDVLQGAVQTLQHYKPAILLATHECHLPGVKENCVHFLEALGYQLTHTGNHNKQVPGLDDYIAVHPGKYPKSSLV